MHISITDLKSQVETYITTEIASVDNSFHGAIRKFADWIDGKQKTELAAVALLRGMGYGIVSPTGESLGAAPAAEAVTA